MEIIELTEETMVDGIINFIQQQKEGLVWGVTKYTNVFGGRNNVINENYCREKGIPIFRFPNEGGTTVVHVGDVSLGHFSYNTENTFNQDLMERVVGYLKAKGLNATTDGNDLMLDGVYKCGSHSSRRYGNILYSAFHISVGMDLENIKNICTKPMNKIPKGLSEFGVDADEIKDFILSTMEDLL